MQYLVSYCTSFLHSSTQPFLLLYSNFYIFGVEVPPFTPTSKKAHLSLKAGGEYSHQKLHCRVTCASAARISLWTGRSARQGCSVHVSLNCKEKWWCSVWWEGHTWDLLAHLCKGKVCMCGG